MSELTTDVISKILLEKFPPKMVEVEGEQVIDTSDPQTIYSSIIVALARRIETNEKSIEALNKQTREVITAVKTLAKGLAEIEQFLKGTTEIDSAVPMSPTPPPPPVAAVPPVAPAEETEEEIPQPNVRATQATNVMPNATPAPNGRS